MSRRGIRFLTPEVTTEVAIDELERLRGELEKIADGAPRLAVAADLAARLDTLTVPLDTSARTFEPDAGEQNALLRATDHLRNLDHHGDLLTLRGRLVGTTGVEPIGYVLRFLDGRRSPGFTSYSLSYEVDDRLVTPAKEELRVVEIRDGDPAELTVHPGRRALDAVGSPAWQRSSSPLARDPV
jgi:hypothetical protein